MSGQKKIFITGASGYIGSVITQQAITSGYTVHALSRSSPSDSKLSSLGATPIRGDLSTHDILTREAAAADIVISLADALAGNFGTMTMEERVRINNGALTALAEGLKGTGKPLVVTSGSLAVAADPEGKETNESSPPWSDSPFSTGSEDHAFGLGKELGIRICAIRLAPYVYGRGGSGVKLFMGMAAAAGSVFYVDSGSVRITTVHVDDAARLYLLVAEKGRAGEVYNATSETHVTQRQLTEAMGKVLALPVREQSYADTEAKMGLFFAKFLSLENRAGNRKAMEEFGWVPQAKKGILEEIASGSYVEVAEGLRKPKA
ncbi:putative NAD dependent epimerase/dehydratase [Lindgomyces ingoldianus]|uniref:NAD dependent epimerase/dehydratase n=1 Tax=Lindgomyces ingoldianus TaxID=673940 RepID=A0ACB6R1G0_9PLEO|nr:putative NAD dependent epimerase/dehydratase [Lindgomyces ingoldianus]KAF2472281.1 putative NAD dependent epimerase/dehydratase [Lindgomyces ingoldianus]